VLIIVVSDATCQNRLVALNRLQNLKRTTFNLFFFFFAWGEGKGWDIVSSTCDVLMLIMLDEIIY
jgi:hypothetical protein